MKVTDSVLHAVEVQNNGTHVACGDKNGVITLLELGSALSVMQAGEKPAVSAVLHKALTRQLTT